MTAPAGRDDEIILCDLFRAETFVKERERPKEEHLVDWPILAANVTCQIHNFLMLIGIFPSVLLCRSIKCSA